MKLATMTLALALGSIWLASPSSAASNYASGYQLTKATGGYVYKHDRRIKRPERPSCYAWAGGCTGL